VSYEITLKEMRFHAQVGILPHERESFQPLEVDLRVSIADDSRAPADVVDYRGLYDAVSSVIDAGHIDYLEEIADRVVSRAMQVSARIERVHVAVRKPHVALGGPLAYAEVSVERAR
jgi:dihydroneopterin aldolase